LIVVAGVVALPGEDGQELGWSVSTAACEFSNDEPAGRRLG